MRRGAAPGLRTYRRAYPGRQWLGAGVIGGIGLAGWHSLPSAKSRPLVGIDAAYVRPEHLHSAVFRQAFMGRRTSSTTETRTEVRERRMLASKKTAGGGAVGATL